MHALWYALCNIVLADIIMGFKAFQRTFLMISCPFFRPFCQTHCIKSTFN